MRAWLMTAAAIGLGMSAAAMAQTAPPPQSAARPRLEPTPMLLQAMCIPWINGIDARRLSDMASAKGFKPQWIGSRLGGMLTPDALSRQGWIAVNFVEQRTGCNVMIAWVGSSPLDYLTADLENWLNHGAPGGPYSRKPAGWKEGEPGKAERQRAWESAAYELTIVERPEAMLSEMNDGKLAVEVWVYLRRK